VGVQSLILAFVYLGPKIPRYVITNMQQVSSRFPSFEVVFIGDNEKICKKVKAFGFRTWVSPNPDAAWGINRLSLSHDPIFRDGFWFRTLARFFALNEFLKVYPNVSCLLIESDVWISPSFPMHQFDDSSFQVSFPVTTSIQGVASTFYVKSSEHMQQFLDFSSHEVQRNPNSTDVTILAEYRRKHPERVTILPSGPTSPEAYNLKFREFEPKLMSDQTFFKKQIFDASTWGQFLTGEEPRNSWGFRLINNIQLHHAVNPSLFEFKTDGREFFARFNGVDYKINSLHVHSKDRRVFKDDLFLPTRFKNYSGCAQKEIVWKYFIRLIPSRFKYELRRRTKF
jgi:hypothetical protein